MTQAKKRFGQNFLHDQSVIQHIVHAIDPQPEQHFVEIGPGLAAITRYLMAASINLDVIEIDRDLIADLKTLFADNPRYRIYNADALTFSYDQLVFQQEKLRIAGNLPYNISTPILFYLLKYISIIEDLHFMLQKEVVDRIVAEPNSKIYGRLSVMIQYHFQATELFSVSRHCFKPVPKVESAILRLVPHQQKELIASDESLLAEVVRLAFNQRRKTIRNSLKSQISAQQLEAIGINPTFRAEQLWTKDYVNISNLLHKSSTMIE